MMPNYVYSDVNKTLKTNSTGNYVVEYDVDSIKQSIRLILSTVTGEIVRSPVGSSLYGLLFEPMNRDTETAIRLEIFDAITRHEPRVRITNIDIDSDYENNLYDISIDMVVKKITNNLKFRIKLRSMGSF